MIKNRVLEILKEKRLKQTYLIEKLNISRQALNVQLNSESIQLDTANRIAKALDVPLYELFVDTKKLANTNILVCPHCNKPIKIHLE